MAEEPKTFLVTFMPIGGSSPIKAELGQMAIDRKTLAIVKEQTTMKLDDKAFRALVEELRKGTVVGSREFDNTLRTEEYGEIEWWEGRAEGLDPPEPK